MKSRIFQVVVRLVAFSAFFCQRAVSIVSFCVFVKIEQCTTSILNMKFLFNLFVRFLTLFWKIAQLNAK